MSTARLGISWLAVCLAGALVNGCSCGETPPPTGKDSGWVPVDAGDYDSAISDRQGTDQVGPDAGSRDRRVGNPDANNPNNDQVDSDCDGMSDAEEFGNIYAGGAQTDPANSDSDGDGIPDGVEVGRTSSPDPRCANLFVADADPTTTTDPTNPDSDGDGLCDGIHTVLGVCTAGEDSNANGRVDSGETDPRNPDTDGDGLCDGPNDVLPLCTCCDLDPLDPVQDSDADGVPNAVEEGSTCLDANNPDSDGDGLCDGDADVAGVCVAGEDLNGDGLVNSGETDPCRVDTDCDGVSDADERLLGLNPLRGDSDGDLIRDGIELCRTDNLDAVHCTNFAGAGSGCIATDPLVADSDGDGLNDGIEDADWDGVVDSGETNPNSADTDGDQLCDGPARTITGVCHDGEDTNANGTVDFGETDPRVPDNGTSTTPNPNDPNNATKDSDCDGLSDAEEFGNVYAGGRTTDPANRDSDGDGILDGIELGRTSSVDSRCAGFVGDADSASRTDPTRADSDGDGLCDGGSAVATVCVRGEDVNNNGRADVGETDPRNPDTDHDGLCDGPNDVLPVCTCCDPDPVGTSGGLDSDGDGVLDSVESASSCLLANNPDSDGDGLCDGPRAVGACVSGEDVNGDGVVNAGETDPCHIDTDCDGVSDSEERTRGLNPRKKDSDGDMLSDGVELCKTVNLDPSYCASFIAAGTGCVATNPLSVDSDADGINDGVEDADRDGVFDNTETNPNDADTDGDGLCDGPSRMIPTVCSGGEDLNANGRIDQGETDPRTPNTAATDTDRDGIPDAVEAVVACLNASNPDTDGDGLCDGGLAIAGVCARGEDLNNNGRVDPGETSPCKVDTDCDGLVDGATYTVATVTYRGEQTLGTSPTNPDSDGDGIGDGLEAGVSAANTPPGTSGSCGFVADADPTSTTNPADADSDDDGIGDGAEDANQNGRVDCADGTAPPGGVLANCPGGRTELNPNNSGDASGPAGDACATANLVPVQFLGAMAPDVLFATAAYGGTDAFSERNNITLDGTDAGVMLYNPAHDVAVFAIKVTPGAGDTTASVAEAARRATIGNLGAAIARTFTTWDGFTGSVLASYDDSSAGAVKTRANDIVTRLLGSGAIAGTLAAGGGAGPHKLQLEYIRRTDQRMVIAGAIIPAAGYTGVAMFRVDDAANGSALAQFGDGVGVQCDIFQVQPNQRVDFVLVIDNSGSMDNEQRALAAAADEIGAQLSSSTVDWRVAVITTDTDEVANSSNSWLGGEYPQSALSYAISWVDDSSASCNGTDCRIQLQTTTANAFVVGDNVVVRGTAGYDGTYGVRTAGNPLTFTERNGNSNTARESNAGTVTRAMRYCTFTSDTAAISTCVTSLGTNGSGEENHLRSFGCAMGSVVSGPGINQSLDTANGELGGAPDGESCGRDGTRAPWVSTSTYVPPPSPYQMLPRADGSIYKIRTGAQLAVIFLTDANDQSDGRYDASGGNGTYPGDAIATHSIPTWASYFQNFDGQGGSLSRAFVAGLVCPVGGDCTDETGAYSNPRWRTFFTDMGGIEAELPGDGTANQSQLIGDAIRNILQQVIGSASPYHLTKPPISSTIRVATNSATAGTCPASNILRSRQNGWDYDGATGNITFYGNCRPVGNNTTQIAVSYRYWIDRTGDPGGSTACNCTPPQVCDELTQECYCPPDCGQGAVPPEQVCDTATCMLVCRPDCGAGCAGNSACNSASGVCACECPSDCGGTPPSGSFVCDRNPASANFCQYVCSACPGTPSNPNMTCDPLSCRWTCPDCAACPGLSTCSGTTCACECTQTLSCGVGYRWDATACDCVCNTAMLGCAAPYVADADVCACVCPADCGGVCGNRACNRSTCECACPADCGVSNIPPTQMCNTGTCQLECRPDCGATCTGYSVCNTTPGVCACECPSDCGGAPPSANFTCDRTPGSPTYCEWTCADCPLPRPNDLMQCNHSTCTWNCPTCGNCPGVGHCSPTTCACECTQALSCGAGYRWDTGACDCVCDTASLACDPAYEPNAQLCACTCKPNCGDTCGGAMTCNESLCACIPIGG